jgi:DNA-binding NarL/FixJ family response regulator
MPASRRIKVLLADDHFMVREGLRSTLRNFKFVQVVGMAEDGFDALRKVELLSPDVVLMDINMPQMNGLEATAKIRELFPATKVLVVTVHDSRQYVSQILRSGAHGYITKDTSPEELARAIRSVCAGQAFLSPSITRVVVEGFVTASSSTSRAEPAGISDRESKSFACSPRGKQTRRSRGLSPSASAPWKPFASASCARSTSGTRLSLPNTPWNTRWFPDRLTIPLLPVVFLRHART